MKATERRMAIWTALAVLGGFAERVPHGDGFKVRRTRRAGDVVERATGAPSIRPTRQAKRRRIERRVRGGR